MRLPNRGTTLRVLGFVLLIALVVPFVVHAVPALVGAEHSYVVLSGSMEPKISPGDSVIVDEQPPAAIERGDVITFATERDSIPTTHRVVEIQQADDGRAFVTKGDANEGRDPQPVAAENVVGTMAFSIPYIGYVIRFAGTTTGFALLVGGPITLLVLSEAIALGRSARIPTGDETDGESCSEDGSHESPEGAAEGATDDTDEESHDEVTGDTDTVAITATDLRLALVVLGVFAAYSTAVAFLARTAWSVAVAVAVMGCLGLGVALAWSARRPVTTGAESIDAEATAVEEDEPETTGPVADGGQPENEQSDEDGPTETEGESS